jgi:predicted nucleic acid-binding protein
MNAAPPFGGGYFIADSSAWARSDEEAITESWGQALQAGQIATCTIVKLELLYSTQTTAGFRELEAELSVLRDIPVTRSISNAAVAGMRRFAEYSDLYHRIPLPDYLIAACAEDAGLDVLHYDRHFDRLAEVFTFESCWLAPAGSLD